MEHYISILTWFASSATLKLRKELTSDVDAAVLLPKDILGRLCDSRHIDRSHLADIEDGLRIYMGGPHSFVDLDFATFCPLEVRMPFEQCFGSL